ncbi:unnamed protein product [Notodromas monacha]|uniref:Fibrillin 1 n=1 Tax=Notodromas monacha TaxID=399045 RepID=A0A7R9BBU0_9CRUS|nr:unnamed protein product [Notodromas monacha]CAG0912309.1 unnamed protein product [Notodromas monacha]
METSFNCICGQGYVLSSSRDACVDTDECAIKPEICGKGVCMNTPGSHRCECYPGFRLTPSGVCEDIDECARPEPSCVDGRCNNTLGSFLCHCDEGWALDHSGTVCIDRREELCFSSHQGDECLDPRLEMMTKKECCCTAGAAWGAQQCEMCPLQHTKAS